MPDQRFPRIHEFIKPFRVEPGRKVKLAKDFDPGYTGSLVKKEDATDLLTDGVKHFNKEGEVEVKDVAELIAEAGDL